MLLFSKFPFNLKALISQVALTRRLFAGGLLIVVAGIATAAIVSSVAAAEDRFKVTTSSTAPNYITTKTSQAQTATNVDGPTRQSNLDKNPGNTPAGAAANDTTTPKPVTTTTTTRTSLPVAAKPPTPAPVPHCPECGGDPDKVVTHSGALIFSANSFTLPAGSSNNGLVTARSDSGEAITIAYPLFAAGSPMVATIAAPGQPVYAQSQTFGFAVSQGTAPGTYMLTLRATSQSQGAYTFQVALTVTPAE